MAKSLHGPKMDANGVRKGYNHSSIGVRNRLLILQIIALSSPVSRTVLAEQTGLTRATLSNIVSELMDCHLVCEMHEGEHGESAALGRMPIGLKISKEAPCIGGILIKRHYLEGVIADLSGHVLARKAQEYEGTIDVQTLYSMILSIYQALREECGCPIVAIGVSCIGPVDNEKGMILNPPDFHGIHDVPLCEELQRRIGVPCYIINDANAGALAEKMYGGEQHTPSFIYVHIMNGIGAGYILNHKLYQGEFGQSGEIGHSSIAYDGPICGCGNVGCLELYANDAHMNAKIAAMRDNFGIQSHIFREHRRYKLEEILMGAAGGDACALAAIDEFCGYVSVALINNIKLFNINDIVVGYRGGLYGGVLERALEAGVRRHMRFTSGQDLSVRHSVFDENAPLYGSVALIADMIFEGRIDIMKEIR